MNLNFESTSRREIWSLSRRLVFALAFLPLVSGCIDEQTEQEIGDTIAADINGQLPIVRDLLLNRYVASIGYRIADHSDRPDLDYQFYIINAEMVNAFALPGGHIYITRGLIEQTRTGDELAAVLAHEIGHVAARHGVQKLQRQLRTGSLVSMLYRLLLGGEPELLRRNALQLGGTLWNASHSREDEKEADELGVEYLARAGINPSAMVELLESMAAAEPEDSASSAAWFSSHPLTSTRIVETQRLIDDLDEVAPVADAFHLTSYPAFLRRIEELPPPVDAL